MSIILVRHGETALNVARVLQPADTPLSATGVAQAQAVAARLAGLRVGAILSSDLPRALVTAHTIGAALTLPVQTTPLLHERNFGDWRGLAYDAVGADILARDAAPPAGETAAQFAQRVAAAFALAVRLRATLDGALVVVSHGLVIREMLLAHCRTGATLAVPERLGNTAVSVVDATSPHAATLLGCTAHLEGGVRDDPASLSGG
jgi:probable phosphoglycerate mutase